MAVKDRLEHDITFARGSLAGRCRALASHITSLADQLDSQTPHSSLCINDLGEIQSQGTIIDAECGRLGAKIEVWRMLMLEDK